VDAGQLQAQEVVLVTDTVGDVAEAREAGVRAIGVTWGMHTEKQLLDAGAERVALWPQELVAWLRDPDAAVAACACSTTVGASATPQIAAAACACAVRTPAAADPVAEAGRMRDERRRESRQAQVAALTGAAVTPSFPRTLPNGAAPSELLRALRRIIPGARP